MCGRFAFKSDSDWERDWGLLAPAPLIESYNIAPSQPITIVREDERGRTGDLARWGLIPAWAKDKSIGYKTFNARGETIASKPAFRAAYKSKRCLVPADGFFEWRREAKQKLPHYFQASHGEKLAMAGLWERWIDRETGEIVDSATLVTMPATAQMAGIHHRMPVLVGVDDFASWLVDRIDIEVLIANNNQALRCYPVAAQVNNARNDEPSNIEPLESPRD